MEAEGIVHALEEIHRLLRSDGVMIDIHPIPEEPVVMVSKDGRVLFAEPKPVTYLEDIIHAEDALAQVIERGLFVVERRAEFDFPLYASSVSELRAYREEAGAFDDTPKSEALVAQEEALYAQAEEVMQASGAGAEVAILERGRITRLKRVG